MKLGRYVEDLHRHLVVAARAGGEDAQQVAERLIAPLDSAARLVLLEALSAAAGEITVALAPGAVEVRLHGREPEFVVSPGISETADVPAPAEPAHAEAPADDGATTRTTLRLPDNIKARVEDAAARDGVSVNTWLVRAVGSALDRDSRPTPERREGGGQRLRGWVR
ncbi:histidine kinase [Tsukamurella sp. 8F]|uniref:histidine kinase n=1 Tax=unclassified Tsukamurella TaxID=2633480 RepID=UPI0023B89B29|nr:MULTISPECIES: histidine kinase [unclassified Tsukamurella]MDF0528411.1 histidine kinase [Tsukamurella sp. 8J]MDF0586236.1 histidine kinase [Tsukamurella sp. 8F]